MTSPSQIDPSAGTVTRTVEIAAPRDLVWAALTTPDQIARWFGVRADFPDGVHAGAGGSFGWDGHGEIPVRIETYEPVAAFAFTWGTPGEPILPTNATTATFTLTDGEGVTTLEVVESGFDALTQDDVARRATMADNAQGWNAELDELVAYVAGLQHGADPTIDLDAGTVAHSVLVRADRPTTWRVLTTPSAIERWWGHPADFPDGMVAGSTGSFAWVGHGQFPVRIERIDEPTRFELRWGDLGETEPGPDANLVVLTLTAAGDSTVVTVVEHGFDETDRTARRSAMEENVTGWRLVLDGLVRDVEGRVA